MEENMVKVKKLFQYYGGKYFLIPDIIKEMANCMRTNEINCIVDVFGGSAQVILSVPQEWKVNRVYNDIDSRLFKVLKVLQDKNKRDEVIDFLSWSLRSREEFNEFKNCNFDDLDDVETAKRYLYLTATCFNGDLGSFGVFRNSNEDKFREIINLITKNAGYLQKYLTIENLDFRELIKKYADAHTLFYLDPPYLKAGKKYKYSFDINDFKDLKSCLDSAGSKWLMNESEVDFPQIKEIFGEPAYVKSYLNTVIITKKSRRFEGFWRNY